MKKVLIILLAATFGMAGNAMAFHDGGVANCEGCHTMHNSQDGAQNAVNGAGTIGNGPSKFLTKGSDPSSTCLNCHKGTPGGYHILTDGTGYAVTKSPGGDFFWLKSTTHYTGEHGFNSMADNHGHNVIAADYSLGQDGTLTTGPSDGTKAYAAADLGCNSCHDPHGKVGTGTGATRENSFAIEGSGSKNAELQGVSAGNYVLLGDAGYDGGQQATWGTTFDAAAPIAQTNRKLQTTDHADYLSGMSEWCANCHTGFAQATADVTGGSLTGLTGGTAHTHPAGAGATLTNVADFYNKYQATGEFAASAADSYDILVPFERASGTAADLDTASTTGPAATDQVMCLSCHHAHASGFNNIGRWDFEASLLAESPIFITANGGLGEAAGKAAYYDMLDSSDAGVWVSGYNAEQRSLCNKCHLQD